MHSGEDFQILEHIKNVFREKKRHLLIGTLCSWYPVKQESSLTSFLTEGCGQVSGFKSLCIHSFFILR